MRFHPITILLMVCCLAGRAGAAYAPPVEPQQIPNGALVRVNHRTVLVLRRPSGGMAPAARAALVATRLETAIQGGLAPGAVQVRRIGGKLALLAGGSALIQPTRADARAAGTPPRRLIDGWAAALRRALALPPLTVSARALLVPFGESRALRVGGVATGPLSLAPRDPRIATAEVAGDGRSVRVRAGQPGTSVLAIGADGALLGVRVVVEKYAGEAGPPVTIDCSGRPAPAELVRQWVLESYSGGLRLEPGARIRRAGPPRLPGALAAGSEAWASVPVRLTGPGLLPRSVTVRVRVRCRRLPPLATDALIYSNDPERVRRPGRLCLAEVDLNTPCRLLYHHQNGSGRALIFHVDLINPDAAPAEIQVISGAARPVPDAVLAGQRAGARYLRSTVRDVGRLLTLPGLQRTPLLRQRLPPGYTASGLYGLRLLRGPRLLVEVRVEAPAAAEPALPRPDAEALRQQVYPNPLRVLTASYTVGRNWTFVQLGKKPLPGLNSAAASPHARMLDGDYGVLYDIAVRLDNPTPEPRIVRLMLAPDAGGAQGVFLVEGHWVEVPHVSPPAEFQLAQFLLSPQEHRVVTIRTLPVGGSAYPVTLVVR